MTILKNISFFKYIVIINKILRLDNINNVWFTWFLWLLKAYCIKCFGQWFEFAGNVHGCLPLRRYCVPFHRLLSIIPALFFLWAYCLSRLPSNQRCICMRVRGVHYNTIRILLHNVELRIIVSFTWERNTSEES